MLTEVVQEDAPRVVQARRSAPDAVFRLMARGAGVLTLLLISLIGLFLLVEAWPALRVSGFSFLSTQKWEPLVGEFGISAVLVGTVLIAAVALTIAVPVSVAAALFITDYAPRRLRGPMTSIIDLLAAIPSLIYGLWGLYFLQPRIIGFSRWLSEHVAFVPIFRTARSDYTSSAFIAGVVVSLMVLPICTAVIREVFSQAPPAEKEGALALGATKWGMVRTVVLPFGRGGIVGGAMLGLGRALGETIAVTMIISPIFTRSTHILESGGNSIAALIALQFGEASDLGLSALMAAGLVLFALTLVVNLLASVVVARSRSGSAVDI